MGKKEKKIWALHGEFQAMINLVPKLEGLLSIHKEIAESYRKHRKNGGAAIPGIEKHLGIKDTEKATSDIAVDSVSTKETKKPKVVAVSNKPKKEKVKKKLSSVDSINDAKTTK